jgi:hydrogenase 3 maturation protease
MRREHPAVEPSMGGGDDKLLEQLGALRGSRTVIVGVGNTLKADDGAGPLVCQQLQKTGIGADIIDAGTVPENYIGPLVKKAPENVLVIDAMDFGAEPGTIQIFRPQQLSRFIGSTHTLSPRVFTEMLSHHTEVDVYFVGIQPARIGMGQEVSGQVSRAVQQLSRILTEVFPL